MKIPINLNEVIKVKLTDLGKVNYFHRFDQLNRTYGRIVCKPEYPIVDEDGYTSFQLWDFMELYGSHMGMASPPVIENNTVIYDTERRFECLKNMINT